MPSALKYFAPYEMAPLAKRWPERSIAIPNSVPVAFATLAVAAAQSSHVALASGTGTPACSNSVRLTIGPVTVSWVGRPWMPWSAASACIQGRVAPKFASQ